MVSHFPKALRLLRTYSLASSPLHILTGMLNPCVPKLPGGFYCEGVGQLGG
jgi:hypothetical protein